MKQYDDSEMEMIKKQAAKDLADDGVSPNDITLDDNGDIVIKGAFSLSRPMKVGRWR